MLGEKIGETSGKVIARRALASETGTPKVEVSFESTGKILGFEFNELGTYCATLRQGGNLYGEGQGIMMFKDGDTATWIGSGVGKPTGRGMGAVYRGAVYYQTNSQKLARLNSTCVVFEYEVDENGATKALLFEWK